MAAPIAPAWYQDADDPVQLRHWNGRAWDARRRTVPAWAVGAKDLVLSEALGGQGHPVLDGPVHPAVLPAIAAATAPSSRPLSRPVTSRPPGRTGGATRTGTAVPGWAAGSHPTRSRSWSNRRGTLVAVASLIGLVALVLAATFGVAPLPSTAPTLADDAAFTNAANIACGEAMGAIRLLPVPAMSAAGTPSSAGPSAVAAANRKLVRLAAELRALPMVDAARAPLEGWLDDWSRFATDRQRQVDADATPRPARTSAGASLASTVSLDADAADAFATSNGLGGCTLTASNTPVPTP